MHKEIRGQDLKESIVMAFNLGVWIKQQKGQTVNNVSETAKELRDIIYWNMSKQYGNAYPDDLLNANVEYFLEIALLGYILPGICLPDEELKNRLLALIEAKARSETPQQSTELNSIVSIFNN
jgi:hypothetical protein